MQQFNFLASLCSLGDWFEFRFAANPKDRLYVHSSIAIILMGKRELIALLNLSSWCLVMVERLFLVVPRGSLQFVIVVFPDHTHLLFLSRRDPNMRVHCLKNKIVVIVKLLLRKVFSEGYNISNGFYSFLSN